MTFNHAQMIRVAKRVQQATGYMELGMPRQSLECLRGLGELGPFEAEVELLRGEALRAQRQYDAAASSLKIAARKFPAPFNRSAWFALSLCYRQAGDLNRAIQTLGIARGAQPPQRPKT